MSALTVGSLFAGIGGFDLGLERAGMRCVWQSELDGFCQRVLAKHWPDVLRVPDVRDVNRESVPYVDVICGGFPCQDLSYAGAGAGLEGARSGLWSEYARLIGELRPRYVVVENVAALLARGLGTVLADLAAVGYDAEWDCIPASAVGAPHRRDRIWLVAYPNGEGQPSVPVDARPRRGIVVPGELADAARVDGEWSQRGRDSSGRPELPSGNGGGGSGDVADAAWDLPAGTAPARAEWERAREGRQPSGAANVGDPDGMAGATSVALDRRPGSLDRSGAQQRAVGPGGGDGSPHDWWSVEPDVGRVAHELSPGLDGGGVDDPERSRYQEARAAGASHDEAMRAVRSYREAIPPSPGLLRARADRGALLDVPSPSGRRGRHQGDEEAEGLHDLRNHVHELQPLAGEDLLAAMSKRSWPPRGHEAMGWWDIEPPVGRVAHGVPQRVDRLRSLGNSLVPQIAEWIGLRIVSYEAMRQAA